MPDKTMNYFTSKKKRMNDYVCIFYLRLWFTSTSRCMVLKADQDGVLLGHV